MGKNKQNFSLDNEYIPDETEESDSFESSEETENVEEQTETKL